MDAQLGAENKKMTPLREERVYDLDEWQARNKGLLAWVELIKEEGPVRIDKLVYTVKDGLKEFILSVQAPSHAALTYFATDFTAEDALAYIVKRDQAFVNLLHSKRKLDLQEERAHGASAKRGSGHPNCL